MPIYRKFLASPNITGPSTLTDIAGLSPLKIQAGASNYSFIATLNVSGLTIPSLAGNWGVVFRIMHGSDILASYYMGQNNGEFRPSFSMTAVGDIASTGISEDISAKWQVYNTTAYLREPATFAVIWDQRED